MTSLELGWVAYAVVVGLTSALLYHTAQVYQNPRRGSP